MEISLTFVDRTDRCYYCGHVYQPFVHLTKPKLKEIYSELFICGLKLVDLKVCNQIECFLSDSDDTDLMTITKDLSEVDLSHGWDIVITGVSLDEESSTIKQDSFKQIETFVEDISKELDLK